MPLREAGASRELDAAALDAAGTALDVALEARLAFLDVQSTTQILELRRSIAFATSQSAEVAQKPRRLARRRPLPAQARRGLPALLERASRGRRRALPRDRRWSPDLRLDRRPEDVMIDLDAAQLFSLSEGVGERFVFAAELGACD